MHPMLVPLPTFLSELPLLERALVYAALAHHGQVRKTTKQPYVYHPQAVAKRVADAGYDEATQILALLHDVAEDQGGLERLEEIEKLFGGEIRRRVECVTETVMQPKPAWRERKVLYLRHLESAPEEALAVAAADKIDNLGGLLHELERTGPEKTWSHFNASPADQVWFYTQVASTIKCRSNLRGLTKELWGLSQLLGRHLVQNS